MKKKSHYIVILAGGKGERLWPLSREQKPKQLLPLDNQYSLLEQTVERVVPLTDKKNIFIITTEEQRDIIQKTIGNKVGKILTEPVSRNTAPALLLVCLEIFKNDKNATIGFLPADHFIVDNDTFQHSFSQAMIFCAMHEGITLLGLKPQWAATGYGYIEYEITNKEVQKVIRFHEKPSTETAKLYITLPNMLWNIGIFCGQASVFIHEFKKTAPEIFEKVYAYWKQHGDYGECGNISFDHAVLEKSKNVYVVPANFSWSDVGNLDIFLSLRIKHNKIKNTSAITINSQNNIVDVPKKLVALIGIENLCIVDTDDVLLISQRSQTDEVKLIIRELKLQKQEDYL